MPQDQQQQAPPPASPGTQEEGVLPTININEEKRENKKAKQSEAEETAVLKDELAAAKDELDLLKSEREALVAAFNNTVLQQFMLTMMRDTSCFSATVEYQINLLD